MKYLNKLFFFSDDKPQTAPTNNQANNHSSATLTQALYSKIFIPEHAEAVSGIANQPQGAAAVQLRRAPSKNKRPTNKLARKQLLLQTTNRSTSSATFDSQLNRVTLLAPLPSEDNEVNEDEAVERKTESGPALGGYLLTATIGKTATNAAELLIASDDHHHHHHHQQQQLTSSANDDQLSESFARLQQKDCNSDSSDSDWILINERLEEERRESSDCCRSKDQDDEDEEEDFESILLTHHTQLYQMALDAKDVELIKASWIPMRKNPNSTGVLLFRGLFTKFPEYLKFFPQFNDLDIERMHENKRLLKHAVKVIETVTFVVDSIGDEEKTSTLQTALVNLVKGHLKRNIGLAEFRNLGIVLIDFICDVNNRRDSFVSSPSSSINSHLQSSANYNRHQKHRNQLLNKSTSDSSQSNDSETMTSALDKIRASTSPSSSSEEESYLVTANSDSLLSQAAPNRGDNSYDINEAVEINDEVAANGQSSKKKNEAKIDTSVLVAAWTKLYGGVLDLVKHEEAAHLNEKQQNSA